MKKVGAWVALGVLCVVPSVVRSNRKASAEISAMCDLVELRGTRSRVVCAEEATMLVRAMARASGCPVEDFSAVRGERYRLVGGKSACELGRAPMSGVRTLALGLPIQINRAVAEDVESLPGIGPKLAASMVAERRSGGLYRSADDLQRARGIGSVRATALAPLVAY